MIYLLSERIAGNSYLISLQAENKILLGCLALFLWFVITSAIDFIRDVKRQKKIEDQRYKEHKAIIDALERLK